MASASVHRSAAARAWQALESCRWVIGSPAMLSAPHCRMQNCGSKRAMCASICGHTVANSASPAPAGTKLNVPLPAGAGIQAAPALVQVGEDDSRVVFEGVVHAIAMVRVDVDIGDACHAVVAPQMLDDHAAIVEHAESRGPLTRGVMQAADRHERAPARAPKDPLGGRKARSHYAGRGLEHTTKSGRVAAVQPAISGLRALHYEANVLGSMKQLELGVQRVARLEHPYFRVQTALLEFAQEGAVPVGAERMPIAKTISGEPLAQHDSNLGISGVQRVSLGLRLPDTTEAKITYEASTAPARSWIMRAPLLQPGRTFHGAIHLHHESRVQGGAAQAHHPARYQPVVLPRGQNRGTRPERIGQVLAAANHGGHGPEHRR